MSHECKGESKEEANSKMGLHSQHASEETTTVLNGNVLDDTMTTATSAETCWKEEQEAGQVEEEEGGGGNGMKEIVEGNLRESLMTSWDDEEWPWWDCWSLSREEDCDGGTNFCGENNDFEEEEVIWEDDVWHLKDIKEIPQP